MEYDELSNYTKVSLSVTLHHLPYITKTIFKHVESAKDEKEFRKNAVKALQGKIKVHKKAIQQIRGGGI